MTADIPCQIYEPREQYETAIQQPDRGSGEAAQAYREQIASYPRDYEANLRLATLFGQQGLYEKAVEIESEMCRSQQNNASACVNLANRLIAMQRLDEAKRLIHEYFPEATMPLFTMLSTG